MTAEGVRDQGIERRLEMLRPLERIGKFGKGIRHGGIQHDVGKRDVLRRADHAEFKLIAREGEGGGAVSVGGIPTDRRNRGDAEGHIIGLLIFIGGARDDRVDECVKLLSEEHRDDGGRRLTAAEAVVVPRRGGGDAEQLLIFVHRLDDGGENEEEELVFSRGLPRLQKIDARVGGDRPVVVLSRAVDAREGLLGEKTFHAVLRRDLAHTFHGQKVLVDGNVGGGEDGRQLVLGGGDLIVLGLRGDAKLPKGAVKLPHEGADPRAERAEIVILQLLPFDRGGAEEGPAAVVEIAARLIILGIDEEILLLRADGGIDSLRRRIAEEAEDAERLGADGIHRAEKGRLGIERLPRVGAEGGGDIQGAVLYEGVGRGIPRGIAARLEGGAQSARGERGGVRLTADKLLSRKLHDRLPVSDG